MRLSWSVPEKKGKAGRNASLGRGNGADKEPSWSLEGRGLLESCCCCPSFACTVCPEIPSLEESVLDQQGGPLRSWGARSDVLFLLFFQSYSGSSLCLL